MWYLLMMVVFLSNPCLSRDLFFNYTSWIKKNIFEIKMVDGIEII
jgi:hypothetical protein